MNNKVIDLFTFLKLAINCLDRSLNQILFVNCPSFSRKLVLIKSIHGNVFCTDLCIVGIKNVDPPVTGGIDDRYAPYCTLIKSNISGWTCLWNTTKEKSFK